jgi:ribonuclease HII
MDFMGSRVDPKLIPKRPNFAIERKLWKSGIEIIAGLDEAGRGALAGPVAAGAVVFANNGRAFRKLVGVRDSKQINQAQREYWREKIEAYCLAWSVGMASSAEIDQWGIIFATQLAMDRALQQIILKIEHLLVDALVLPENSIPQTMLLKGDQRSLSIAAASIFAKTSRDQTMVELHESFPEYGFAQHKGYGTRMHRGQLADQGASDVHRKSFKWKTEDLER